MMKCSRRHVLQLTGAVAMLPALTRSAKAQAYPARPVRIISGFPPGGVNDTYARLIGQWLSERLGQQFYVENRPGAGGNIAAETLVRSAPDGYTLLLATSADAWNATLYDNLKFNFIRDSAAVAPISRAPGVLVVHPSLPSQSVPELIAYAKSNPGKIPVASAGIGSAPHMYWELFRNLSGVDLLAIRLDHLGEQSARPLDFWPVGSRYARSGKFHSYLAGRLPGKLCHWPNSCRVTRRAFLLASSRPTTRLPKLLAN